MRPHEAMHHALAGHRKTVAHRMGLSVEAINKMCEAPRSEDGEGYPSFIQRTIEATLALREVGAETSEGLLQFICGELGYFPAIRITAVPRDPADVQILADATRESADILATWSRALADRSLSVGDAEDFRREIRELLVVLGGWDLGLAQFIAGEEAARITIRRGPKRAMPRYLQLRKAVAV